MWICSACKGYLRECKLFTIPSVEGSFDHPIGYRLVGECLRCGIVSEYNSMEGVKDPRAWHDSVLEAARSDEVKYILNEQS